MSKSFPEWWKHGQKVRTANDGVLTLNIAEDSEYWLTNNAGKEVSVFSMDILGPASVPEACSMTTDITELARIARINAECGEHLSPAETMELVEALEKARQVDEELCKLLPPGAGYMDPPDGGDVTPLEGVRRMVADYRQRIAELREWNAGLAQESFERQQRISELLEGKVGNALLERENHHVEVVGKLTEHIDQLESRTVTVKMPDEVDVLLNHLEDVLPFDAFQLIDVHKWNAVSRLSAAGIKVEAE